MKIFTIVHSEKSGIYKTYTTISPVNIFIFYFTILNLGKMTRAISLQRILLQEVLTLSQKDNNNNNTTQKPSDLHPESNYNFNSNSTLPVNITQLLQSPNNLELYATVKLLQEIDLDQEDCLQLLLLYKNGHIQDKELVPMIWLALLDQIKNLKNSQNDDDSYQRSKILQEDEILQSKNNGIELDLRRGIPGGEGSNLIINNEEEYGSGGYETTQSYPTDMKSMYEYANQQIIPTRILKV